MEQTEHDEERLVYQQAQVKRNYAFAKRRAQKINQ
jgi:hypothetical protein